MAELDDLVARSGTITEITGGLSELESSERDAFWSGAALVLGVSPHPVPHRLRIFTRGDPWRVVGDCLVRSLKFIVANDPSLPPLPDDLYLMPESRSKRDMIERSSI